MGGTEDGQVKFAQAHVSDMMSCSSNPSGDACIRGQSVDSALKLALVSGLSANALIVVADTAAAGCLTNPVLCANEVGAFIIETLGAEAAPAGIAITGTAGVAAKLTKEQLVELATIQAVAKKEGVEVTPEIVNKVISGSASKEIPKGTIATGKPNNGTTISKEITYEDGIHFALEQKNHLTTFDGITNKGVYGTHNLNEFTQAASENGIKIISQTPSNVKGISEVVYQVPKKNREGNIIPGEFKDKPYVKTVYDPKVFSDQKMLDLGQQAASNGYKDAISQGRREYQSTAGGVKFQVYLDQETGRITNFFPVTE